MQMFLKVAPLFAENNLQFVKFIMTFMACKRRAALRT